MTKFRCALLVLMLLGSLPNSWVACQVDLRPPNKRLKLQTQTTVSGKISTGTYRVFENRETKKGRELDLEIVILHATGKNPKSDPIFFLAGGPGQAAATLQSRSNNIWMRKDRDIVLVSQRGTGGSNRLAFPPETDIAGPQNYLRPLIEPERAQQAAKYLGKNFDLRMYSTPTAMDDLNEIRDALGYRKINLIGGSYGTRAALVYIRRHGETVRTATLNGVAPIEFKNPLYHAREAQNALNKIFDEIESDETYRKAFPELREKFDEVLTRLDQGPVEVDWKDQNGKTVTVKLTRQVFCTSLRFQLYYLNTSRRVPLLLLRAYEGDFRPFARNAISRNRALGNSIAMGMLLSVTAAEDVARIKPEEIAPASQGTFLGDRRVKNQMAACRNWPKSKLPDNFGEPVKSNVQTLILSGSLDPVTGPRWGEVVHRNFPNSVHIVAPAAHGVGGPCIEKIQKQFLASGRVKDLDLTCVKKMKLPPLVLPKSAER